jgi:methylenetetrahydrofolate--tRNA-(uracil-5-)-methyltransferase
MSQICAIMKCKYSSSNTLPSTTHKNNKKIINMTHQTHPHITIIGAGLAGSEAAWQAAQRGVRVTLIEMRNENKRTFAHQTDGCAELVCSNSFRADDHERNAVGLLHEEMRRNGSLIMRCADENRVPAGGALAMDREAFSHAATLALTSHPLITLERREITELPKADDGLCIVATGPLTSDALADSIKRATGAEYLSFFDAIAPIISRDSIDMTKCWFQSRYDKGDGADYLNCPMSREQYETFVQALNDGEKTEFKEWEKNTPYFEGCLPIEVMAARGVETLRFGPMKPVGLTNPHAPEDKPYAIVQLRQDNKAATLFNMVGFQTKLKYGEQQRIFRSITGLENAEFVRLGGIHRNTFINSPTLLDESARLKNLPHLRFAGQITGVEGYVESAACGLMCGRFAAQEALGYTLITPPRTTAMGALLAHITGEAEAKTFQPMNVNFGLFPALESRMKKTDRPVGYTSRALADMQHWQHAISSTTAQHEHAA